MASTPAFWCLQDTFGHHEEAGPAAGVERVVGASVESCGDNARPFVQQRNRDVADSGHPG